MSRRFVISFLALQLSSVVALFSVYPDAEGASGAPTQVSKLTPIQRIEKLETGFLGKAHPGLPIAKRLDALENSILGINHSGENVMQRLSRLEENCGELDGKPVSKSEVKRPPEAAPETSRAELSPPETPKADLASTLASAVSAYDKHQIESARDLFEKVLTIDPNNVDANFSLGCIAEDRGDISGAQSFYAKAHASKPDDSEIAQALQSLKAKILDKPPQSTFNDDVAKASSEFKLGHYAVARKSLEHILSSSPTNDRAHFALAECLRHLGDQHGALAHFKEALRLKPDSAIYKSEKEKCEKNGGVFSENLAGRRAGEILPIDEKASVAPKRIDSVSWEARNLVATARVSALKLLDAMASGNLENIESAEDELSKLRIKPPDPQAEAADQINTFHARGNLEAKQGLLGDALIDYRKAFSLNPWDSEETLDLVRLEIQNQDWAMASQHCFAAIGCKPAGANNWLDLGLTYLHQHDLDKSEQCFAYADSCSGTTGISQNFLKQALGANSDASMRVVLERALQHSLTSRKLASIGIKYMPSEKANDPLMTAYRSNLLIKLADKWGSERGGTIVVVTVDRDGKIINSEIAKSSGDKELDARADSAVRSLNLDPLPSWWNQPDRQLIVDFDKVSTMARGS